MPRYPSPSRAADGLSAQVYSGLVALAQASGRELFPLHVGDTYLEPPPAARVARLAEIAPPGIHRYAGVQGEPALLDAIVESHARRGAPLAREDVQVTPGATSGLDLAARALLEPGDEVLLLAPYWPLIRGILEACGARPRELPIFTSLRTAGFDLGTALEAALSPRTAAIYVNSPNNPTGVVLDAREIDTIARFAERHGLWVLSDEAYERLAYVDAPPAIHRHAAVRERSVIVHTLSKSYGLAGARIGYVHGPRSLMPRIAALSTFTNYCAARPLQLLAARALSDESEPWLEAARRAYRAAALAAAEAVAVTPPEGGTFVFFDTRPFLAPGESAAGLLERCARAGVVLTPGSAAGVDYAAFARLCFTCVPPDVLTRALATLREVLYAPRR